MAAKDFLKRFSIATSGDRKFSSLKLQKIQIFIICTSLLLKDIRSIN